MRRIVVTALIIVAALACWAWLGMGACTQQTPAITGSARPTQWAQPLQVEGVPNLHRVSPTLYRSAQPTPEGMKRLEEMGVKTVVSLRAFHSDREPLSATSIKYERISVKSWHIEKEDALRFLKLVTDPANQPVLVHCQHGADRTGTMCAVYRMAVEGWSKDEAVKELTEGGYGFHEIWENMKKWLDTVNVDELRATIEKK